jgi:hypothetical protein
MTGFFDESERHVVPRWHSFGGAVRRGELSSVLQADHRPAERRALEERRIEWEQFGGFRVATDYVGNAIAYEDFELAKDAAEYILAQDPDPLARRLAETLLSPEEPRVPEPEAKAEVEDERAAGRVRIRRLKRLLSGGRL